MAKAPPAVLAIKREPDRRSPPLPLPLPLPKTTAHADAPPEHIGLYLRKAREQRGEELGDIWRMLKIAEHHDRHRGRPFRRPARPRLRSGSCAAMQSISGSTRNASRRRSEVAKRGVVRWLPVTKHGALGGWTRCRGRRRRAFRGVPSAAPSVRCIRSAEHRDISALLGDCEHRGIRRRSQRRQGQVIGALLGGPSAAMPAPCIRTTRDAFFQAGCRSHAFVRRGFRQSSWVVTRTVLRCADLLRILPFRAGRVCHRLSFLFGKTRC